MISLMYSVALFDEWSRHCVKHNINVWGVEVCLFQDRDLLKNCLQF